MSNFILIGLVNNAALLLALGLLYDTLASKKRPARPDWLQVLTGLILGGIGIAVMANPVKWSTGIIFDTRSVLLSVAGLYFGTVPTLVAVGLTAGYRLHLGGGGAMMGVAVTVSSGAIGVVWRHWRRREVQDLSLGELYLFGVAVHVVMVLCMFLLPRNLIADTLFKVGIPVMIVYPLGTALLGRLMAGRQARHRAEAELRENQEKFQQLFELGSDAILLVENSSGRILEANSASSSLYGYSRDELLALTIRELSAEPEAAQSITENMVSPGQVVSVPLRHHRKKDGTVFPVETTYRFFDWQGRSVHISAIRDITARVNSEQERLRLERQMQQSQKLESLGVLAGGIAHDFNNLLATILGNAGLALNELSPDSPVRPNLEEIDKASHRAADLCRQMLAYAGKGRFVVETIQLRDLIQEIAHLLGASISKRAHLSLHLDASVSPIRGDATQIRQVIMNLVMNAAEAIGERDGVIQIITRTVHRSDGLLHGSHSDGAEPQTQAQFSGPSNNLTCSPRVLEFKDSDYELPPGPCVSLEITDTGCGMDAETQQRIFDPFFTTKFAGRGLGLSAVLGIVRSHKGILQLISTPGQGTTFRIFFPAAQDLPVLERTLDASISNWRGCGTVLLADDEPSVLATGQKLLKRLGFDVLTARDGQEAVAVFREHRAEICLVLLDLTMPYLDGAEAMEALRALDTNVRVVLCSGYTETDVLRRFGDPGLAGFIQKPYSLEQLRFCLHQALNTTALGPNS
jgi:PAS domain S-box-containing protein